MNGHRPQRSASENATLKAYGLASFVSVAAIVAQHALATKAYPTISLLLALGAVILSSVYGGLYPSLVALCLTGMSALYTLARAGSLTMSDGVALALLAVLGVSIGAASGTRPRYSRHVPDRRRTRPPDEFRAANTTPSSVRESMSVPGEQMMRALRAARMVAWECDLRSGLVAHTSAMEVFGTARPRSPLSLRNALRFVYSKDRHEVLARARAAIERHEPSIQHFRVVVHRGAAPSWMENHTEIVCDEAGHAVRACGTMIDITAHRQALDALAATDRRKDEFIATLAHELRNPLSAISTAAQILRTTTLEGTQVSACVDMIRRQTNHLARLVDDLLDVSRAIRDRLEFRRERIDLRSTITAALETVGEFVSARHLELQTTLPREPVEIEADPVRLAQVFENLLTNAAKYTPHGGSIRVVLEECGEWANVRVSDSGIGIAAEDLGRVFEPFYQVNASLSRARGGLGIGLALVRRITQLHGGTVEATSAGLGCGSEFTVRLPVLDEHAGTEPTNEPAGNVTLSSGRPRRILIADDDADVAEAMALGLRMCGHDVAVALDGDEALRIADEFRPQVALLDLGMPKRPGHDVARELRQRPWAPEQGLFVVALTGWAARDLQGRIDMSAFDSQMMKPTEIDAVNRLVLSAQRHAKNSAT